MVLQRAWYKIHYDQWSIWCYSPIGRHSAIDSNKIYIPQNSILSSCHPHDPLPTHTLHHHHPWHTQKNCCSLLPNSGLQKHLYPHCPCPLELPAAKCRHCHRPWFFPQVTPCGETQCLAVPLPYLFLNRTALALFLSSFFQHYFPLFAPLFDVTKLRQYAYGTLQLYAQIQKILHVHEFGLLHVSSISSPGGGGGGGALLQWRW